MPNANRGPLGLLGLVWVVPVEGVQGRLRERLGGPSGAWVECLPSLSRRISFYFIPIPKPRKKGKDQQQTFDS